MAQPTARAGYDITTTVAASYEDAVSRVKEALKREGFGVLTEIDVKKTMKEKLDEDFTKYVILGACNPPLAHRALTADVNIGLLLPCNVIVYEGRDGRTVVSAADPEAMLEIADNPTLREVAAEARARLARAVASL